MNTIFVYGTLLRGLGLHDALAQSDYLGLATIRGQLVDLGYYPGLISGNDAVVGEVYRVDSSTLQQLDHIEGYNPQNHANSHYLRQHTRATLFADGSVLDVETYRYNCSVDGKQRITIGDYRRYLAEQQSDSYWVAAYGSNLDPQRLMKRVGTVKEWLVGTLPGFVMRYNKEAMDGDHSYANICHKDDAAAPAVAYRLTHKQLQKLDGYEGVPEHYCRTVLPFYCAEPEVAMVHTYIAQPDWVVEGLEPTATYRNYILQGYRYHQLTGEV